MRLPWLALLSLVPLAIAAEPADPAVPADIGAESDLKAPRLKIDVTFPESPLGVNIVNGKQNKVLIHIGNDEPEPVEVSYVGGSIFDATGQIGLRNLTTKQAGVTIKAGEKHNLDYSFESEMRPQEVTLNLAIVVKNQVGQFVTLSVYNSTASVVEQELSIFDPQVLFLYLILAAIFGGAGYFVYSTWLSSVFPKKQRSTGGRKSKSHRAVASSGALSGDEGRSTGVDSTGQTATYDESWIPEHHIKKPVAQRVRSGTPQKIKKTKSES